MDKLEESFIKATISEGAINPSNKGFSTKEIAKLCGVSEFSLFMRFKTKDNLIKAAIDYVNDHFIAASKKAALGSRDLEDFVRKLVYYGFSQPEQMEFLANYGFWTGKDETDEKKRKADLDRSVAAGKAAFRLLGDYDDATVALIWAYVTRHINYFVENVFDGLVADSPDYRNHCAKMLSLGLQGFATKGEAKHG